MPDPLYKFLQSDRLTYLDDQLLRFTQPLALNDPFECRLQVDESVIREDLDRTNEEIRQFMAIAKPFSPAPNNPELLEAQILKYIEEIQLQTCQDFLAQVNRNVGILSLSERWESSLMWAHYTQDHEGFCVGFNPDHPFFRRDDGKVPVRRVTYSDILFKANPTKDLDESVAFHKSSDWKYEREWRLLVYTFISAPHKVIGPMKGMPINLYKVPHDSITELIAGLRSSPELQAKLLSFAKERNIPLYCTKLSSRSYNLERVRID